MTISAPPLPRLRIAHLLVMTVLYFSSVGFLMQFPRYVLRLGGNAQEVGWLLAIGLIPTLLMARAIGEWNRKVGGRWTAALGALIAAASNVAMLAIDHVGVGMILLRLLFGVGHTMMFGTLFAQAAFLVDDPAQRARVIGWLAVMTQLGNAVGGTIGELAYEQGATTFWLGAAGFALMGSILGLCWTLKPQASEHEESENDLGKPVVWPSEVWATAAVAMTFAGASQFLPAFIDHMVQTGTIAEPFASSWFLTSALLVVALVRFVGGWFAHRLLRPKVLMACHGILLATMILMPWMHTKGQAFILGVFFGLSYGWLYPALNALAFSHVPAHARGKAAGWMMMAYELGFRLSPVGLGALIAYAGYHAMFFGLVFAYLVLLFVARNVKRKAALLAVAAA